MNNYRKQFYDELRALYDTEKNPAESVGWRNQESLDARFFCTFRHLSHKIITDNLSILDVGCGVSLNFLRYLPKSIKFEYTGIDCNADSIREASKTWNIPVDYHAKPKRLLCMEDLSALQNQRYDIILCQGIYQEFDSISAVQNHVVELSKLLNPDGELLIMTPTNRILDAGGLSVLRLSAYDAVSILESTKLPYELFLGELGEHIIMRVYRESV